MKYVFAVLLVVGSAVAFPQIQTDIDTRESRFIIEGQFKNAIEQVRVAIRDAGLDPLHVDREEFNYVAVPSLLELNGVLDSLEFTGLSNIVINNVDYSTLLARLRFDIELPEVRLSVGDAGLSVKIRETRNLVETRGSLAIKRIRLSAEVRISIGIISGISIRSLALDFTLGGVESNIELVVLGNDYSSRVNTLLGESIPQYITENRSNINAYLEDLVLYIFDLIL